MLPLLGRGENANDESAVPAVADDLPGRSLTSCLRTLSQVPTLSSRFRLHHLRFLLHIRLALTGTGTTARP